MVRSDPEGHDSRRTAVRRETLAERVAQGSVPVDQLREMARGAALRCLTSAPRSRAELQATLYRKGFPRDVVEPLLDRFEQVALVDDSAYAAMIVRTRHQERGLARRAIAVELRRRGIDEAVAADALGQIDDDGERDAARMIARSRLERTRGLDRDVRLRRVTGVLARKGISPGAAFEIVVAELDRELTPEGDEESGRVSRHEP